jgi:hypothetical protein
MPCRLQLIITLPRPDKPQPSPGSIGTGRPPASEGRRPATRAGPCPSPSSRVVSRLRHGRASAIHRAEEDAP